jgi:hypothetical protein
MNSRSFAAFKPIFAQKSSIVVEWKTFSRVGPKILDFLVNFLKKKSQIPGDWTLFSESGTKA